MVIEELLKSPNMGGLALKRRGYEPDAKIFEEWKARWFSQMALVLNEQMFLDEGEGLMA